MAVKFKSSTVISKYEEGNPKYLYRFGSFKSDAVHLWDAFEKQEDGVKKPGKEKKKMKY